MFILDVIEQITCNITENKRITWMKFEYGLVRQITKHSSM